MNISEYSKQLRVLTELHVNYQLTFEDYRRQRKELLDSIDKQYNGIVEDSDDPPLAHKMEALGDKTRPYLSSKIGQCINFLKRNTENE